MIQKSNLSVHVFFKKPTLGNAIFLIFLPTKKNLRPRVMQVKVKVIKFPSIALDQITITTLLTESFSNRQNILGFAIWGIFKLEMYV